MKALKMIPFIRYRNIKILPCFGWDLVTGDYSADLIYPTQTRSSEQSTYFRPCAQGKAQRYQIYAISHANKGGPDL